MSKKRIMDNARAALADTRTPAQVAVDATAEKLGAALGKAPKHTPGPWSLSASDMLNPDRAYGIVAHDDCEGEDGDATQVVAEVCTSGEPGAALADARLIAAAPDLLAALQLVYANAAESPEWIRERIGPAIAKAGGAA